MGVVRVSMIMRMMPLSMQEEEESGRRGEGRREGGGQVGGEKIKRHRHHINNREGIMMQADMLIREGGIDGGGACS